MPVPYFSTASRLITYSFGSNRADTLSPLPVPGTLPPRLNPNILPPLLAVVGPEPVPPPDGNALSIAWVKLFKLVIIPTNVVLTTDSCEVFAAVAWVLAITTLELAGPFLLLPLLPPDPPPEPPPPELPPPPPPPSPSSGAPLPRPPTKPEVNSLRIDAPLIAARAVNIGNKGLSADARDMKALAVVKLIVAIVLKVLLLPTSLIRATKACLVFSN